MRNVKKVNIVRTALLAVVVVVAGTFAYAVYDDRSTGTLVDEQGIVDKDFIQ